MKLWELLLLILVVVVAAFLAYKYLGPGNSQSQFIDSSAEPTVESASPEGCLMPPVTGPAKEDSTSKEMPWVQPPGSDGQWRPNSTPGEIPNTF